MGFGGGPSSGFGGGLLGLGGGPFRDSVEVFSWGFGGGPLGFGGGPWDSVEVLGGLWDWVEVPTLRLFFLFLLKLFHGKVYGCRDH